MHSAGVRVGSTHPEVNEPAGVVRDFRLYGHRGAPKEHPENTFAGFEAALEAGCNALELDVHLSRDGYVVVCHDEHGERMAGVPACVRDCTWQEVSRWNVAHGFAGGPGRVSSAPLLEEVIDAFGHVPISVDLKSDAPALTHAVLRLLARATPTARAHVSLTSFHRRPFQVLSARGYSGPLGMGPSDVLRLWALPVAALRDLRGRAAQVPVAAHGVRFASKRFIDKVHALGARVDFWVINDAALAQSLIDMGADGLVTDDARTLGVEVSRV